MRPLASILSRPQGVARRGFTLIEVLIVVSLIALLIGILLPALGEARKRAQSATCLSNTRQIAIGIHTFVADKKSYVFPTSQMYSGVPYFMVLTTGEYLDKSSGAHRCPNDGAAGWSVQPTPTRTTSYAINGYFAPNHDPYGVAGQTDIGVKLDDVRDPSHKVIVAELAEYVNRDHFMPMYWGLDAPVFATGMFMMARPNEIDAGNGNIPRSVVRKRHAGGSHFAFTDGHGAHHPFTDTWNDANTAAGRTLDWYDPKFSP